MSKFSIINLTRAVGFSGLSILSSHLGGDVVVKAINPRSTR
ncbi:MAG: hypothetical protein WED05_12290 [Candidatus Atabeyarchaeum deiterrae]